MSFTDRTVLVVGGTGAIGKATALAFAAEGARVVVAGRDEHRGNEVVAAVKETGGEGLFLGVDVTSTESVTAMVDRTVQACGTLDCAFNNAGWEGVPANTHEITEADWQMMLDIKLSGVWRCMKAELGQMLQQERAVMVNMAGNWGLVGFPQYAAYCAAAHGVMGITRAAAKEYGGKNIRINAVCPAAVDTPLLDRMTGGSREIKDSFGTHLALGRIAQPEEVAQAVVWLCSDGASYITGEALVLDGG